MMLLSAVSVSDLREERDNTTALQSTVPRRENSSVQFYTQHLDYRLLNALTSGTLCCPALKNRSVCIHKYVLKVASPRGQGAGGRGRGTGQAPQHCHGSAPCHHHGLVRCTRHHCPVSGSATSSQTAPGGRPTHSQSPHQEAGSLPPRLVVNHSP